MKAWQLIEDESRWTTGVVARDQGNAPVCSLSPEAVRWCAMGAIARCYVHPREEMEVSMAARHLCQARHGTLSISRVNDGLGHAAILAILKELDV